MLNMMNFMMRLFVRILSKKILYHLRRRQFSYTSPFLQQSSMDRASDYESTKDSLSYRRNAVFFLHDDAVTEQLNKSILVTRTSINE